jgi:phospholipase/carboxylesterase
MDNSKSAPHSAAGEMLDCVEVTTAPSPRYAVIWMHGLGADGHDFEPVVPYLGLPADTAVRFVFPHALMRPVTINAGMVMRAWFDVRELSTSKGQDTAGIEHSAAKVRELIERERERGIEPGNIVLAGFSQGGAMALHVGLRYPHSLAGIMALSAFLLFPERLEQECSPANRATPVFMAHGSYDPVLPMSLGQAAKQTLEVGQWPVEWHTYPIPHSVSPEEITDIGRWLQSRFA